MARKPSRHVGTLGDMHRHGHTLTRNCESCRHHREMDLDALILANGEDYLLRKIVDRAKCSKCGGEEISVTTGVADAPGYSYPSRTPS